MPKLNALLICSLAVIAIVGVWGVVDIDGLVNWASGIVQQMFHSRGWFVMLATTSMLFACLFLAFSRYGNIRLGRDDERPKFSTPTWIAMLFSAGMGVGLLFWAVAEPLTHFSFISGKAPDHVAAKQAMLATNFHWGLHAWAIYGTTALTIAFFSFRRGTGMLVSAPLVSLFPGERWAIFVGWLADFFAIIAIAIGVGGSMAMGVFQVADGVAILFRFTDTGAFLIGAVFVAMVVAYVPALMIDLGAGMARLSNIAMLIAIALVLYTIVLGPTEYLLNTVLSTFGDYLTNVVSRGFQTYGFFDDEVTKWFNDWTLTYMVWWIAWGPFVGVFVARISRGRTIREFVIGVLFAPTLFSLLWFGAFGGIGLYEALHGAGELLQMTENNVERVTFGLLDRLPLSGLTTVFTILAAFLFIVTSVVSAAFVLGTFSTAGDANPPPRIRLIWGALLGLLSVAMILSGSVEKVKILISLGAMPFVFISVLLLVCLIRGLRQEGVPNVDR
ncbi:choline/glycine/proline betaine transport protein/glycine betaine transporter [Shimia gijangensis]|uniref:Choline/glycine/proline betaine transport protein/glycine betaine transporter n=1 Tax=Shimia gijangensis TaxID=1470563 RepID=A0A1M6EAC3_9RHOB|nr:BCCT family transporter [Shimia gijangensis]SHI82309.1 choline/glycine/proline betaine transport protein/glycine betaine transporter [Shimia gijangensis]